MENNSYEYINDEYKSQIDEIPNIMKDTLNEFIQNEKIHFHNLKLKKRKLKKIKTIIITGSNNEYHTSKAIASNIELLTGKNTFVLDSFEMINTRAVLDNTVLVVIVSPNSNNQQAVAIAKRVKESDAMLIAISNTETGELDEYCKNKISIELDNSVSDFCKEYLLLALLGLHLGYKMKYIPKLTVSVTLKLCQMLPGNSILSGRNKFELKKAADIISKYESILFCGYSADEGIADELAHSLRKINKTPAFSMSLCQIDSSLYALKNTLVVIIISSGADIDIINYHLNHLRQNGIDTLIFTTESISNDLCIKDSIVTVTDSIPLFNPATLTTSVLQTAILNNEIQENADLSA